MKGMVLDFIGNKKIYKMWCTVLRSLPLSWKEKKDPNNYHMEQNIIII